METNTPLGLAKASIRAAMLTPFAIEIIAFDDHVAEVDADAQFDAAVRRDAGVPLEHCLLHRDRAAYRVDDTSELRQKPVASLLDDPAVMIGNFGIDCLAEMRLETLVCPFLVCAHQPGIPCHIGGEDAARRRV